MPSSFAGLRAEAGSDSRAHRHCRFRVQVTRLTTWSPPTGQMRYTRQDVRQDAGVELISFFSDSSLLQRAGQSGNRK